MLSKEPFQIDDWQVEPLACRISRDDFETKLEPKTMALLVYLAQRPGEVIPRQELEDAIWGDMVVGYDSLSAAITKLRKAFADNRKQPRIIETIPKVGYRLVAEVARASKPEQTYPTSKPAKGLAVTGVRGPSIIALALVFCALLAAYYFWPATSNEPTSYMQQRPSIAVLPFVNLSNDPEQEYFSDGMTEDIITELSKVSGLFVIASKSSFYYRDKTSGFDEIGRNLKTKYLLQGSIRKSGNRVRITAQLVKAENAQHLWAERFDRKLDDVFSVQDEITDNIISSLVGQLGSHEKKRLTIRETNNVAAYDMFLQGQQHDRLGTKNGLELAQTQYREAIRLDPRFGRAYGALAVTVARSISWGLDDDPTQKLDQALELAQKAVELNSMTPQTFWALSYVHLNRKEHEQALDAAQRTIELAPNYADGYGLLALVSNYMGRGQDGVRYITRAMALNPHFTWEYPFNLGFGYYLLGDYENSMTALKDAIERNENIAFPRLYLISAYVRSGQLEDARWEISQLRVMNPQVTISYLRRTSRLKNQKALDTLLSNLTKAGLAP